MSEVIAIKTLNGHPLVDTEARAEIEALKETMGDSSESSAPCGLVVTISDEGAPSHTVEEIFNAYHSGRSVTAVLMGFMVFQLKMVLFGTDEDGAAFILRDNGSTMELIINSDNTIGFNQYPDPGAEHIVYLNDLDSVSASTLSEIKDAVDQGLRVRLYRMFSPRQVMELSSWSDTEANFTHITNDGNTITIYNYAIGGDGAVKFSEKTITG